MTAVKPAQIYFSLPGAPHHHEVFSSGFAPFNSGIWSLDIDGPAGMISLEWDQVTTCVVVDSVKFVLAGVVGAPVTHIAFEGGIRFPAHSTGVKDFFIGPGAALSWIRIELVITSGPMPIGPVPAGPAVAGPALEPGNEFGAIACRNAMIHSSYTPHDVVFYFPRSNRELWANSKSLTRVSPKSEGALDRPGEDVKPTTTQAYVAEMDDFGPLVDDSDDEADAVPIKIATSRTNWVLPPGVKEIVVKSAAYTTYYAVFTWLHYNYIGFAPLSPASFFPHPSPAERPTKRIRLDTAAFSNPSLPLTASPKSVYKLAQALGLHELRKIALSDFKSKLTADNVLHQLASPIAACNEVRDAIGAFAKANWAAVKASKAMGEVQKKKVMDKLGTEFGVRLAQLMSQC